MIESSWHSYSTIYTLGHPALDELFNGIVRIEEKIDGSQINFGIFDGELKMKSKGANLYVENPEPLFKNGIQEIVKIKDLLTPGWTYRGEYLFNPKHNALKYERIPNKHIIIFDIAVRQEVYLNSEDRKKEAERLGLECVPILFEGIIKDTPQLLEFLKYPPLLGGNQIEGFVVKNYNIFGKDKKILIGKTVNGEFKEIAAKTWKAVNLPRKDFVLELAERYKTDARWNKAIQHLRDDGLLTHSMKDISPLLKEINLDIIKECEGGIKQELYDHFWPEMSRFIVKGFAEYYKKYLFDNQQIKGENLEEENKKET